MNMIVAEDNRLIPEAETYDFMYYDSDLVPEPGQIAVYIVDGRRITDGRLAEVHPDKLVMQDGTEVARDALRGIVTRIDHPDAKTKRVCALIDASFKEKRKRHPEKSPNAIWDEIFEIIQLGLNEHSAEG